MTAEEIVKRLREPVELSYREAKLAADRLEALEEEVARLNAHLQMSVIAELEAENERLMSIIEDMEKKRGG